MNQSELLAATDDMSAVEDDGNTSPSRHRKRLLGRLRRRDRKGQGENQLIYIIAAIAVTVILGGGAFLLVRSLTSSSENRVMTDNIDQVAALSDDFWNTHAADADGRRKISILGGQGFCGFANRRLAEDDLNLRTLQIVVDADAAVSATNIALNTAVLLKAAPLALAVEDQGRALAGSPAEAKCVATSAALAGVAATHPLVDILIDNNATRQLSTARQAEIDKAGLQSTRTVWMAQFGGVGTAAARDLSAGTSAIVPDGTDNQYEATTSATTNPGLTMGVEYLVFGGVAPSGDSFCLIKVFDASNDDQIGEYRVARIAQPDFSFTTCLEGYDGGGANAADHSGSWPDPS